VFSRRPPAARSAAAPRSPGCARPAYSVRAAPGRLSALSVFHRKQILFGASVWESRLLNHRKWRFPVRAVTLLVYTYSVTDLAGLDFRTGAKPGDGGGGTYGGRAADPEQGGAEGEARSEAKAPGEKGKGEGSEGKGGAADYSYAQFHLAFALGAVRLQASAGSLVPRDRHATPAAGRLRFRGGGGGLRSQRCTCAAPW
jgi:hypothetical protein